VAQIDTASGVINDIKAIGEAVRAAGHGALLMVDTVASLGCCLREQTVAGVSVVEMGLTALGLPHGKGGAQVAVEYLAKAVPA
jgi:alanine-glyoxylate transaminase/serine-glyoxylate transaminase/serine-pyruvate transaminase